MNFQTLREAQLMSYLLSYVSGLTVFQSRSDDQWWVFTGKGMDDWDDLKEYVFTEFNKRKVDSNPKPKWWSDAVLEEIRAFEIETQARKSALEEQVARMEFEADQANQRCFDAFEKEMDKWNVGWIGNEASGWEFDEKAFNAANRDDDE